jgi:hypothetical protein
MVQSKKMNIGQLESEIEAAIVYLATADLPKELHALKNLVAPRGMMARVNLRHLETHRKIRTNADADVYWNPSNGAVEAAVYYEEEPVGSAPNLQGGDSFGGVARETRDLIVALDQAERAPQFREFVGLKPFRDQYLPRCGFDWVQIPNTAHRILSDAIDQGMIRTSTVSNPKSPAYPTKTITLNREHPAVKEIFKKTADERSIFRPITVRGGPVSSTILTERR